MRFSARLFCLAFLAVALTACGGGGKSSGDPSVWHVRGINLITDSPNIQFYVDGTAVANADYSAATDYHPAHTGSRAIKLGAKNPSDLSTTDQGYRDIGDTETHDFQGPSNYVVVATGTVANPHMLLMTGTSTAKMADNVVSWQIVNASAYASPLQVFITAPEAGIATEQSAGTLAQGEYSDAADLTIPVATGVADTVTRLVNITVELRSGATTVYKSKALNVTEQSRVLFVIADNIGPPSAAPLSLAPVKLLAIGGVAAGAATVLQDPDDPAEMRFANISPDTGPLDLIVGNTATDVFATNIALGAASPYGTFPNGEINSIATPAGNHGSFLFVNNFTANPAGSYTLYAQDALAVVRGVILSDNRRSVPAEAHIRFLHASPSQGGGSLDIYLRQSGAGLDLNATTPPTVSVAALGYRGVSSTFVLKPATYDVYVAQAGAKTTILGPVPLTLAAGSVQTLALDDSAVGAFQIQAFNDAR